MEVKYIELILENCEVIKIDAKYIFDIEVNNIKKHISRRTINSISSELNCESFSICISRYLPKENITRWTIGDTDEERDTLDRLSSHNDITGVVIHYENETSEYIFVPWGEKECVNSYQNSKTDAEGDLFITIDKEKPLEEHFSQEYIEFIEKEINKRKVMN